MATDNILQIKSEAKKSFAKEVGFKSSKALIAVVLDRELSGEDSALLAEVLEGAAILDVAVVILADGEKLEAVNKCVYSVEYTRDNREKLLSAADMTVSFDFNDVEEMLVHGAIPISLERSEIADYNPNRETGNAFLYKKRDKWSAFAAMVRACETYKFPYDWKNIVRQGIDRE